MTSTQRLAQARRSARLSSGDSDENPFVVCAAGPMTLSSASRSRPIRGFFSAVRIIPVADAVFVDITRHFACSSSHFTPAFTSSNSRNSLVPAHHGCLLVPVSAGNAESGTIRTCLSSRPGGGGGGGGGGGKGGGGGGGGGGGVGWFFSIHLVTSCASITAKSLLACHHSRLIRRYCRRASLSRPALLHPRTWLTPVPHGHVMARPSWTEIFELFLLQQTKLPRNRSHR